MTAEPKEKVVETLQQERSYQSRAATYNEKENTIECVFATPTPVERWSWRINNGEDFNEVLSIKPEHIDSTRLDAGAVSFLNNHNSYGDVGKIQLGKVIKWWIVGEECRATIQLSTAEEHKGIVDNIINGTYSNISVGYRVHEYTPVITPMPIKGNSPSEPPTMLATKWEPTEISLVAIPADPKSQIRSEKSKIVKTTIKPMSVENNGNDPQLSAPAIEQARKEAQAYTVELMELQSRHKSILGDDFAPRHLQANTPIAEVRKAVLDAMKTQNPTPAANPAAPAGSHARGADHERESIKRGASAGILMRMGNLAAQKLSDEDKKLGQEYRNMSLMDIATDCFERGDGGSARGLSKMEIVKRAMSSTQSDFPVIINDLMNKSLLANYQVQAKVWKQFCTTGTVSDFRPFHRIRGGEFGALLSLTEGGEYKKLKQKDGKMESIQVDTKGGIVDISRKMIINDDMQYFASITAQLGRSASYTVEKAVWALLAENGGLGPTMSDTKTLFHADHGNLIASGAAPSVAELQKMRNLFKRQKDVNNEVYISAMPEIGLAPHNLEDALNLVISAQFDPDATGQLNRPNLVNGLLKQVVGSPYLFDISQTAYYMFADPNILPTIEVAFLNGQQDPFFEMEQGFDVDGIRYKARLDFGVGAIDWVGAVKNNGA